MAGSVVPLVTDFPKRGAASLLEASTEWWHRDPLLPKHLDGACHLVLQNKSIAC